MIVLPFKAEHLMDLQLQMEQRGVAPFITAEYARAMESEFAFTAMVDDKVIAVGGVAKIHENRGLAWSLIDQGAGPHFLAIHKVAKQCLALVPYRRLEADTPCRFAQGHRWLKMLGFHLEAERMQAYQIDGEDSALYARVK